VHPRGLHIIDANGIWKQNRHNPGRQQRWAVFLELSICVRGLDQHPHKLLRQDSPGLLSPASGLVARALPPLTSAAPRLSARLPPASHPRGALWQHLCEC
jgi:hypothetical protein